MHKRKNRTNFITLTIGDKENIQHMLNLMKIAASSNSFNEVKEKIKEYVFESFPKDRIEKINTFHKKRMKMRNDSLYVSYNDKKLFQLKLIQKEQVLEIEQETNYLLGNLKEGIGLAKDKTWQTRGKKIGEFISNYWNIKL